MLSRYEISKSLLYINTSICVSVINFDLVLNTRHIKYTRLFYKSINNNIPLYYILNHYVIRIC